MFLQAAQAGGAQGLQVAQMRQQAAQQEAARQAAAEELAARLSTSRETAIMDQLARQQALQQEGRGLALRERMGMAELALKQAELEQKKALSEAENSQLNLRELRDPASNRLVGRSFGRTVQWVPEEIPTTATPMTDQSGKVVANRFGPRVIPVPRDRAYSQAELMDFMLNPQFDPRRSGGAAANAMTNSVPSVAAPSAAPKRYRWDGGKLVPVQ